MKHKIFRLITISMFWLTQVTYAQTKIGSKEASHHVGDTLTVCGKLYSKKVIPSTGMVLLNLGGYYPNQDLTIVIKASTMKLFKQPVGKLFEPGQICVFGAVVAYKGKPEIIINNPQQIVRERINSN